MKVLMPIPELDFDPTEVAVTWRSLKDRGIQVTFATPTGGESEADRMMLTGEGLDAWGAIPLFRKVPLLGLFLRADAAARRAYGELEGDPSFQDPIKFADMRVEDFDGMVLPGGHRARGMQEYLESNALRKFVGTFFATDKPVGAICHGVLLAARSRSPLTNRSVLYGRKTTALTWALERRAWRMTRFLGRFWDPNYFRTYVEKPGQPAGSKSVESEVTAYLEKPTDFIDVKGTFMDRFRKSSGLFRDSATEDWPAHVVVDGNYVSARWPGDAYTFAAKFGDVLAASVDRHQSTAVIRAIKEAAPAVDPKYDPFAQTQMVSRMPKPANPQAAMNETIIIKSPLLAEKEKAAAAAAAKLAAEADETLVNAPHQPAPVAAGTAEEVIAAAPVVAATPAAAEPVAEPPLTAGPESLLAAHHDAHVTVDDFAKTQVLSEAPVQSSQPLHASEPVHLNEPVLPHEPIDDFAKTQVLSEPPVQSDEPLRSSEPVHSETGQSDEPVDDFAKTQVLFAPPIQSKESVDDFAKTQVLSEPPIQFSGRTESSEPEMSEPPIAPPAIPVDDFEKTQVLSRPLSTRMTSAVDDFDRTLIVKRPEKEELENPQV
jgi:putative intracellular protease/amidase